MPKKPLNSTRKVRQTLWKKPFSWLSSKIVPRGLFPRALIIIIAPVFLLQTIVVLVFMERHWQQVTFKLSRAVSQDISAVVELLDEAASQQERNEVFAFASRHMKLRLSYLPAQPLPPQQNEGWFNLLESELGQQLSERLSQPYWIDGRSSTSIIEIRLDQGDKILRIFARQDAVYASNSHIFIVWMVASSLALLMIAIIFLRNQITPILRLSRQMESFGKGHGVSDDYSPRGATEVRLAANQFLTMKNRLERQMEQRTTMLAGVSHDLRTVLTRFRLQLALLAPKADVGELESDVDQMQSMLQGYLDFVSGHGEEQARSVQLLDMLKDFETDAQLHDVKLRVECDAGLKAMLRPVAIGRLLNNLISNAFKHADEVVVLAREERRGSVRYLRLLIDDNGPGIAEQDREEALKPFARLDKARNLDHLGTGLGLTIANDVTLTHGGSLTLEDSPLGGLRVSVELPM